MKSAHGIASDNSDGVKMAATHADHEASRFTSTDKTFISYSERNISPGSSIFEGLPQLGLQFVANRNATRKFGVFSDFV